MDILSTTGVSTSLTSENGTFTLTMDFTGATSSSAWSNISSQFSSEFGFFAHTVLGAGPRNIFSTNSPDPFVVSITSDNRLQVDLPGVAPQLFDIPTDNMLHRLGVFTRNGQDLIVSVDCREGQTQRLPSTIGTLAVGDTINAVVAGPSMVRASLVM